MINFFFIILITFSIFSSEIFACRISVQNGKKQTQYKKGEVVDLLVEVEKTHGNCRNSINTTEFKYKNVQLMEKSAWAETGSDTYTCHVKLKLTAGKGEKCGFAVQRECKRGNRNSVVYFNVR